MNKGDGVGRGAGAAQQREGAKKLRCSRNKEDMRTYTGGGEGERHRRTRRKDVRIIKKAEAEKTRKRR